MPRTKLADLPDKYVPGFLRELDERTNLYQRLSASYQRIVEDAGGEEKLSHVKLSLIERFVFLSEMLERWELEIVQHPNDTAAALSRWIQAVNSIQGLARAIGTEVQGRKKPNLKAYIAGATA
jgi:hypothetical protein